VHPVAQAGFKEANKEVPLNNGVFSGLGISPVNTALRTCKPAICNNLYEDPSYESMRTEAAAFGYNSMISIPLSIDGQCLGVLNIYSGKPEAFNLAEVKLLQEMTDDLVYGIRSLRAREEHKRIEAELARSEERVRASIENMPDAFSIFSAVRDMNGTICDFRIDYVNAATCSICGMGAVELAQKKLLQMLPEYLENGLFAEYCKVVENGNPLVIDKWTLQSSWNSEDGSGVSTYSIRAVRLGDGLVVAWRDITDLEMAAEALRASESRYLTIFNTASVPICVEDFSEVKKDLDALKANGVADLSQYMDDHPEFERNAMKKIRVQDANESAIRLYEAETKEDLLSSIESLYLPESSHLFKEMLVAMMEERDFFEGETVNRTLKGNKLNVWVRITIPGNNSDFGNLLVSILDITGRRKMEEELLKAQKLESLGVLAGGIAHDFNNMLTVILGNIVLSKMKLNKEDDIYLRLDKAENAINRAMDLTRNLLTFSKVGELSFRVMEIGDLVKDTAAFALSGSKSKCEFYVQDDLWPVKADPGQIRQAIENLIINADQAMLNGGAISIRCENLAIGPEGMKKNRDSRCVKISITDQGPGIPMGIRDKLFDPYFSTKEGKSGLGLATSYSIISNHGGFLTGESVPGQGAVFTIYLPAADTELQTRFIQKKNVQGVKKVLIMDDEEEVREVAEGILRTLGCEVEQAKDGDEAIDLFIKAKDGGHPFDMIILDLTVSGGMGGTETINRLLEIDGNVKAIVSTGYFNDPVTTNYMKFGFKGVLNKPYKLQELDAVLSSVMNSDR
jgi:signal transduction histidine kinase/ActR/RegA family two-component response regulator